MEKNKEETKKETKENKLKDLMEKVTPENQHEEMFPDRQGEEKF